MTHRSIVTAEMPKMFGERVRAHARADATVINLNDLCQSFFLLGKRLVALYVLASRGGQRPDGR